ncbi:carbohydrate kinase family protein [Roseateles terrae]|uniref:Fructokinase n=1 Tax=Roseateles terrae TaxID=431060 RepID=A0ABR6GPI9_9BURK|nr:carbohydrate kinase [Roseateles terrae]MBB3193621.1 fructokinase [Roseateles terrae]OWQ89216.1 carbohydrate kinase [Roseateles terrae]
MIVVSGEALMDVFDLGPTATGHTLDARIGGSPLNVAIGLARLGQAVRFFGGVSRGFLGERLMAAMTQEGVDTTLVQRTDAPTTLSLVGVRAGGVPDYAFYSHGAAEQQLPLSALAAVAGAAPAAAAYHFGSYAMVIEPTGSTLRTLVEREGQRSVIAYDPNVRLNVEPDLSRWRSVIDWMVPRTHLFKVSEEDLSLLYPSQALDDLAAGWLAAGAALVVVTRGGEGALAWSAAGHVQAAPVPVDVVDTVGAGDTFQAMLLTGLSEMGLLSPAGVRGLTRDAIARLLSLATQAAAITCSRRGADLPYRREVM